MSIISCSVWGLCVDVYQLTLPNNYKFFTRIIDRQDVFGCFFFPRDTIATTQMVTGGENEYDGSTDEESENLTRPSLPSGRTECTVFREYHRQPNHFVGINPNEDKILPDKLLCDKLTCKP